MAEGGPPWPNETVLINPTAVSNCAVEGKRLGVLNAIKAAFSQAGETFRRVDKIEGVYRGVILT